MDYQESLSYLNSFINYEKLTSFSYGESFKLDNIRAFLKSINNPEKKLKIIHVAGTKGKGSSAVFIAYILKSAGFKVGLYTSPHLNLVRERIRVLESNSDSKDEFEGSITEEQFTCLVKELKPNIEELESQGKKLTYFEFLTAMSFYYFAKKEVDFAVMETGLGGRLDATNVANASVSVITSISLEHTQYLGNSVEEIAKEKAAIIKRDSIVISAKHKESVQDIILECAKENNSEVLFLDKDFHVENVRNRSDSQLFDLAVNAKTINDLEIKLKGRFQVNNAALAVMAVKALSAYKIDDAKIKQGLISAFWPGRFEILESFPVVMVDGAQNPHSIGVLMDSIKNTFPDKKIVLVLGVSSDKDIVGICEIVKDYVKQIVLTQADSPRAASSITIEEDAQLTNTRITASVPEGIKVAKQLASENDLILITGSLFVVAEARQFLKKEGKYAWA